MNGKKTNTECLLRKRDLENQEKEIKIRQKTNYTQYKNEIKAEADRVDQSQKEKQLINSLENINK